MLPMIDDMKGSWRWGYETLKNNCTEIIVSEGRDGISLYKKQRPEIGSLPTKKPKSIFYKAQYSSGNGTRQLFEILERKLFSNPKPIDLIKDIAIKTELPDMRKRKLIFEKTGFSVDNAIKVNEILEDNGEKAAEPAEAPKRKAATIETASLNPHGLTEQLNREFPGEFQNHLVFFLAYRITEPSPFFS